MRKFLLKRIYIRMRRKFTRLVCFLYSGLYTQKYIENSLSGFISQFQQQNNILKLRGESKCVEDEGSYIFLGFNIADCA